MYIGIYIYIDMEEWRGRPPGAISASRHESTTGVFKQGALREENRKNSVCTTLWIRPCVYLLLEAYQGTGSSNIQSGKRVNTRPWLPAQGLAARGGQHLKTANIAIRKWKKVSVSRPCGRRMTVPLPGGSGSLPGFVLGKKRLFKLEFGLPDLVHIGWCFTSWFKPKSMFDQSVRRSIKLYVQSPNSHASGS